MSQHQFKRKKGVSKLVDISGLPRSCQGVNQPFVSPSCKPGSVPEGDDHLSWTPVARNLLRPTRWSVTRTEASRFQKLHPIWPFFAQRLPRFTPSFAKQSLDSSLWL